MDSKGNISGVLIAGGENGNIILYDPSKILAGDKEVVIAQNDKHTGPVRALDVNIFQVRLLTFIHNSWDMCCLCEISIWTYYAYVLEPKAKNMCLCRLMSKSICLRNERFIVGFRIGNINSMIRLMCLISRSLVILPHLTGHFLSVRNPKGWKPCLLKICACSALDWCSSVWVNPLFC